MRLRGPMLMLATVAVVAAAAVLTQPLLDSGKPAAGAPVTTPTPAPTPFPALRNGALLALAANPPLAAAYEVRLVRPDGSDGASIARVASRPAVQWAPRGDSLAWADENGLYTLTPGAEPRRLGDQPQRFWWSPAGTHIATYDGQDLRALDLGGRTVTTATVEGDLRSLVWSPSGSGLAWTVHRTLKPYQDFRTAGANEWTLAVRPVTSTGAQANQWTYQTPGTTPPGEVIAWSPDETLLLLQEGEALRRLTRATSALAEVATGERATVSPRGDEVAYVQRLSFPACTDGVSTRTAITVLTWTTGERSTVLPDHCSMGLGPAWSPDGRLLAHDAVTQDAGPRLVVTDPATGLSRSAGEAPGATRLGWSPDGAGLLAQHLSRESGPVVYAPVSASSGRALGGAGFGGFSHDGRRYLFADDAVRVGTLGGREASIAPLPHGARWLEGAWSPSDRWIAYVTRPRDRSHFALNLESGTLEVRDEAAACGPPDELSVLSPDGNRRARVAWDAERQALRVIVVDNLRTGRTGLLVDGDANFGGIVWAPDSRHVGYHRRPNKAGEPASYGVGTLPAGETREVATFTTEGTLIASAVAPGGRVVALAFGDHTGILLSVEGQPGLVPVARSAAQITCLAFTADSELLFRSAVGE